MVDEITNLDKNNYQFLLDVLEKEYKLRRENGIKLIELGFRTKNT